MSWLSQTPQATSGQIDNEEDSTKIPCLIDDTDIIEPKKGGTGTADDYCPTERAGIAV